METTVPLGSFLDTSGYDFDHLDTTRTAYRTPRIMSKMRHSLPSFHDESSLLFSSLKRRQSNLHQSFMSFPAVESKISIPRVVRAKHDLNISTDQGYTHRTSCNTTSRRDEVTYFKKRPVATNLLLDYYPRTSFCCKDK